MFKLNSYVHLSDVAYDLADRCFNGDFHLTTSAARAASALTSTALEVSHHFDHLLHAHTTGHNMNIHNIQRKLNN